MAVMTGPPLSPNTQTMKTALAWFTSTYPAFHIVSNQAGDYTAPTAVKIATSVFTAHPNLKVYLSNYSEMTTGIVQARKQAGISGTEIYDMGADKQIVDSIKSGDVTASMALLPYQEAQYGVQAVLDQLRGKSHESFYDLTKLGPPVLPGTPFITKQNAGSFTAEY
jgi:ribose transport system substrate-binding protein